MDWGAEGLLEGLEGDARAARAELLDRLLERGFELDELRRAVAERRLALLPIEGALLGPARYTAAQVAERAGTTEDVVAMVMRSFGLSMPEPEVVAFGDEDVAAVRRHVDWTQAGLPAAELLGAARVTSASLARVAETLRTMFARAYTEPEDTELDLGHRYAVMAEALLPTITPALEYQLRVHLRELVRSDVLEVGGDVFADTPEVAIAFVDIVGFTRLGEELPDADLGDLADRLEEMARDRVRAPVRVVKTIGDAVMFVSREPAPLVDVLLDLVDTAEAEDGMPPIRAGIAWGPALARQGDWYGATVNMASRVAGRARPASLLATAAVRDALGADAERFSWSFAGEKRLKNVSAPAATLRIRRPEG